MGNYGIRRTSTVNALRSQWHSIIPQTVGLSCKYLNYLDTTKTKIPDPVCQLKLFISRLQCLRPLKIHDIQLSTFQELFFFLVLLLLHIYSPTVVLNLHLTFLYINILTGSSRFPGDILNSSTSLALSSWNSPQVSSQLSLHLHNIHDWFTSIHTVSTLSTYFLASKDSHSGNRKHWCLSHNDF